MPCNCNGRSETCDMETGNCQVKRSSSSSTGTEQKIIIIFRVVVTTRVVYRVKNVPKDIMVIRIIVVVRRVPAQKQIEILPEDVQFIKIK